jgi:hypothetical protein
MHSRRLRITLASLLNLESMTLLSISPQYGHFMSLLPAAGLQVDLTRYALIMHALKNIFPILMPIIQVFHHALS